MWEGRGGRVLGLVAGRAGGRNPEVVVLGSCVSPAQPLPSSLAGGIETADGLLASGLLLTLASIGPSGQVDPVGSWLGHDPGDMVLITWGGWQAGIVCLGDTRKPLY